MRQALLAAFMLVGCAPDATQGFDDTAVAFPVEQAGPPLYTIDSNNAANDTSRYYVSVSGNWTSSTNVSGYWNSGYWVAPSLWDYDPANFYFYLDADACLVVESWWTAAGDRAPNVPYQSYNASGANLGVVYRNQQANGSRWNEIGRYIFTRGWNRVLISRWADLGYYVIADAVRVTPADNCPGWCGPDADGDGVRQCQDQCDNDPNKTAPGVCGCGVADTDSDGDGFANCIETCDNDPNKQSPGVCGCGTPDTNADGDAWLDCQETCDNDPNKRDPGVCGCGVSDADSDGDGALDCQEDCDTDPTKTSPGVCGCGVPDVDSDGDGTLDCLDGCPTDPTSTAPGVCGCGVLDLDSDGDGTLDCLDGCPTDAAKTAPGDCGCGVADTDSDGDATADCLDACPTDPLKFDPGACGCGTVDEDLDGDGTADCVTCGDGFVELPETCDDGGRDDGDGCDAVCQWEELIFTLTAGAMTDPVVFQASQVQPGERVFFLASTRLGNTPVPGCPGVTAPLDRPDVVAFPTGGIDATASYVVPRPPPRAAGRTFAFVAVTPASCRVSEVWFQTF